MNTRCVCVLGCSLYNIVAFPNIPIRITSLKEILITVITITHTHTHTHTETHTLTIPN